MSQKRAVPRLPWGSHTVAIKPRRRHRHSLQCSIVSRKLRKMGKSPPRDESPFPACPVGIPEYRPQPFGLLYRCYGCRKALSVRRMVCAAGLPVGIIHSQRKDLMPYRDRPDTRLLNGKKI